MSSNFVILRDERTLSSAADIPYEVNIAISEWIVDFGSKLLFAPNDHDLASEGCCSTLHKDVWQASTLGVLPKLPFKWPNHLMYYILGNVCNFDIKLLNANTFYKATLQPMEVILVIMKKNR